MYFKSDEMHGTAIILSIHSWTTQANSALDMDRHIGDLHPFIVGMLHMPVEIISVLIP